MCAIGAPFLININVLSVLEFSSFSCSLLQHWLTASHFQQAVSEVVLACRCLGNDLDFDHQCSEIRIPAFECEFFLNMLTIVSLYSLKERSDSSDNPWFPFGLQETKKHFFFFLGLTLSVPFFYWKTNLWIKTVKSVCLLGGNQEKWRQKSSTHKHVLWFATACFNWGNPSLAPPWFPPSVSPLVSRLSAHVAPRGRVSRTASRGLLGNVVPVPIGVSLGVCKKNYNSQDSFD